MPTPPPAPDIDVAANVAEHDPQEPHGHRHDHNRPDSLGSVFANLRGTGRPWREVLAIAASNMRRKITSLRGCCGNPGQPGC